MSISVDIGSVNGSGGTNNLVGVFNGSVTVGHLSDPERNFDSIKDALFVTDPHVDRETLINSKGRRVEGTCEWITRHPDYKSWLQNGNQLLWISGGPGKGKTIMSIFLTEELERVTSVKTDTKTIFYFCSIQDEKRNTALAILRSLIHQIITQTPHLAKHAQSHFIAVDNERQAERQRQTLSSFETLWIILRTIVTDASCPTTYCVLDGLDESDAQASELLVPRLVELLSTKTTPTSAPGFRLAIVSRNIHNLHDCVRVKLDPDHDEDVDSDIGRFVSEKTNELHALKGEDKIRIRTYVRDQLLQRSEGTFLWVGFAMDELRKSQTSTDILSALGELPSGLVNIYGAMLNRIPSNQRETSRTILTWVTMALEPLSLEQLAAAADIQSSSSIITRGQAVQDEVKMCAPFIQVRGDEVNLVHASARDYLVREETDDNVVLEEFRIKEEQAHLNIAQICLRCMTSSRLQYESLRRDDELNPNDSPLLLYSINHWHEHIKLCPTMVHKLFDDFEIFFQRHSEVRAKWYVSRKFMSMWSNENNSPQLHMASAMGVIPWIVWILQKPIKVLTFRSRKNERNEWGRTALQVAIRNGREEAARFLINKGIDLLVRDKCGDTALSDAVERASKELVLLLIRSGAATNGRKMPHFPVSIGTDISHRNDSGYTLLHYVAMVGLESETRMLIEQGAGIEARTTKARSTASHDAKIGSTALHLAIIYRRDAIVRTLIAEDADVQTRNDTGRTALHEAAKCGSENIAQILIDHGAEIEAEDKWGYNSLHEAAFWGSVEFARVLIVHGANLAAQNCHGDTAFHVAAYHGRGEVLQMLIGHGANVEAKDEAGRTALHIAMRPISNRINVETVQFLLDYGANIEAKTRDGKTPRDIAIEREDYEIVEMLDLALQIRASVSSFESTTLRSTA